jgi:phenylalanyl-tRNA synthetase beta chain
VSEAEKRLGDSFTPEQAASYIRKLGSTVTVEARKLHVAPAEYRNDFLHPVDAVEEIMIGRGMASFTPILPRDFTVGRISTAEEYNRKAREIMIGLGYQEMIYPYLGSKRDFIERMGTDGADAIEIGNPMTESADMVRNSIIPNLLASEAESAHAVYPHRIFEIGKVAVKDASLDYGSRTDALLSCLLADREAGFNEVNAHVLALLYYMSLEAVLAPLDDPRFIPGRAAAVNVGGRRIGMIGEIHPQCLTNWGIEMPCAVAELNLDIMRGV